MRYMFIHNPHPDNPERSVSSRSGKSSIRAHITKEYHRERRLRRTIAHADKARGLASAIPATPSWLPPNLDSYVLELGKEEEEPEEQETELQTEKDTQTARDHESMTGEDNDQNTESVIGSDTDHDTDHGQPPNVEAGLDMKVPEASKASDSVRYTTTIHPVTSSLTWWSPKLLDLVELHDLTWETNRVLEHAMLQTWPMTMPAKGSGLRNPITNIWLQYAVEHPVVLHAFLYAAGIHLHLVGAQATAAVPHECFGLAHKVEAIKLIQDALLNLHTPPSEALIMAVATLAVHGKQDDGYHFPHAHPASPLSHQQYLHIYGRMIPADEHISAFRTLVRLKGGLATIKTYAMAETLAL